MISIALRNLLAEKTRFAISVGGVAFSVLLILIIFSLYQGWRIKATEYIRNIKADIWVTQAGSADISNSASFIPTTLEEEIANVSGVKKVHRFIGKPIVFQIKNKDVGAYIVGFDKSDPIAGPQKMVSGSSDPQQGEIVIDRVLAKNKKLGLGDFIEIFGRTFKIVGIADGANMFLFQFSFINQADALELFGQPGFTNFLLVETDNVGSAKEEINKIEGIEAWTRSEFVDKNRKVVDEVFLPIISVLVAICTLVGTAVIGLTIYTATIEKAREFGVIKAIGGSNLQIYRIIFEQALISGVVGYFIGVGLTFVLLRIIPELVPAFVTTTRWEDLVGVFFLATFMSILASYIPVRRVLSIDPAEVFRS